ncbi:integrase family protein [Telmatospirillum sp.]|uniref:tyrosine-type recombinase/integrase n=1 Tax=Telmatospirillum sp. TaxID=2079197 RepID=UPI00283BC769|nr:integrase family protein [Telmatospirillum sp.]MDR3436520.1 integrase family protein [Telmatospirillum sp.]
MAKPTLTAKLTQSFVDGIRAAETDCVWWDSELTGFGLRVLPSGVRSYLIKYRNADRKSRQLVIGSADALKLFQARDKARELLASVALGGDPLADRQAKRQAVEEKPLTVAAICRDYLEKAQAGQVGGRKIPGTSKVRPKAASTVAIDVGRVERHIVPLIGARAMASLRQTDIQKLYDDIAEGRTATKPTKTKARGRAVVSGGHGTAARVIELLGGIWSWAKKRGVVEGESPVRGITKMGVQAKQRVLSSDELRRLGAVINEKRRDLPMACAAVELLAFSGCRREEVVALRWSEIDADGRCLRLEDTKTGRSVRPLSQAALGVLKAWPRLGESGFVFPARNGQRSADLKKSIASIFDAAGLRDARSHDLRRTFATAAAGLEYSDAVVGMLIGHRARGVTEAHYIRRPDAVLVAAADATAEFIRKSLAGQTAEVITARFGEAAV